MKYIKVHFKVVSNNTEGCVGILSKSVVYWKVEGGVFQMHGRDLSGQNTADPPFLVS